MTTTVLIVEDEPFSAALIRSTLERHGYGVTEAPDAPTAATVLEQARPDLALLDVGLGRGCGIELGESLVSKNIPVVYVTGQSDPAVLSRVGATRPVGFVAKPFSDSQLLGAVRVALARRGAAKDPYQIAVERITSTLVELGVFQGATMDLGARHVPELAALSPREWEVLRGLLAHKRVPSIARQLHISESTVRNHLKSIFVKVGVHSQEELLERLVNRSLLDE